MIAIQRPDGERVRAWLLAAAITAFIVFVAAASVKARATRGLT
jgi:hypothetical protein